MLACREQWSVLRRKHNSNTPNQQKQRKLVKITMPAASKALRLSVSLLAASSLCTNRLVVPWLAILRNGAADDSGPKGILGRGEGCYRRNRGIAICCRRLRLVLLLPNLGVSNASRNPSVTTLPSNKQHRCDVRPDHTLQRFSVRRQRHHESSAQAVSEVPSTTLITSAIARCVRLRNCRRHQKSRCATARHSRPNLFTINAYCSKYLARGKYPGKTTERSQPCRQGSETPI